MKVSARRLTLEISAFLVVGGVLFGPVSQMRKRTAQSTCQSQLKQIGSAALSYNDDYDEQWMLGHNWNRVLLPYTKRPEFFVCPQNKHFYALNRFAVGRSYDWVKDREKSIMAFDSNSTQRTPCDAGQSWPTSEIHQYWTPSSGSIARNNVLYLDGHVKSVPANPKPLFQIP